jgi:hypothetical protein
MPTKESAAAHAKMDDQCGLHIAKHMATLIKSKTPISLEKLWSQLETVCVQTVIDCNGPPGTKVDIAVFCRQIGSMLAGIHRYLLPLDDSQTAPDYATLLGLVQRLFAASLESSLVYKGKCDMTLSLL